MRNTLAGARNAAGAWGYREGTAGRIEPTCWSLLALGPAATDRPSAAFLAGCQDGRGLLSEAAELPANLAFNGLALLTSLERPDLMTEDARARLADALVGDQPITLSQTAAIGQDNTLVGWPWIEHTFSWVEPTAWCVLALKKRLAAAPRAASARANRSRIEQAERLLINRSCASGGWNYGNAEILGHDLRPYVPTSALALLALQDRRDLPVVQRGLEYLWHNRLAEPSGLALSLTTICLAVHGLDSTDTAARLLQCWDETRFLGNLHITAMSLCAQSAASGPDRTTIDAFRI